MAYMNMIYHFDSNKSEKRSYRKKKHNIVVYKRFLQTRHLSLIIGVFNEPFKKFQIDLYEKFKENVFFSISIYVT